MTQNDGSIYTVKARGTQVTFSVLEDAVRHWNRIGAQYGFIEVQTYRDGLCVRDGNILHATPGQTYLNPNIKDAPDGH